MTRTNSPRYVIWLLSIVFLLNVLDRQIVVVLAEPLRKDLGLADTEIGLVSGLAFVLLYATMGIPIARVAEVRNRAYIVSAALAVWSIFTAACGLAQNFFHLFLARLGVGIGEGGCSPPGYALIADYFPPEKRAGAMAHYGMGGQVGALIGMVVGGYIAGTYGWRAAFFVAGVPGLILAIIVFTTLHDPRHRGWRLRTATPASTLTPRPSIAEVLRTFVTKKSLRFLNLAGMATTIMVQGQITFMGAFFLRVYERDLEQVIDAVHANLGVSLTPIGLVGILLAVLLGAFGLIGVFMGGWLVDRLVVRDLRGYMTVPAVAYLVSPFVIAAGLTLNNFSSAVFVIAIAMILNMLMVGPSLAATQGIVPKEMRATSAALMLAFTNGIGAGLGPFFVGFMSDRFNATMGLADGLRYAMISVSVFGLVASYLYFKARQTFAQDFEG